MRRFRKLSLKNKLCINQSRRETVYKFLSKKHGGIVPCFVCKAHVKEKNATIEHILPLSKGGTEEMDNLSISHYQCNQARGSDIDFTWDKLKVDELSGQD